MKQTAQEKAKELCEVWGMEDNHGYSVPPKDIMNPKYWFTTNITMCGTQQMRMITVVMYPIMTYGCISQSLISDNTAMETTIDSNGLGGFQTRQDRILCIRSQINRSSEELDRINEKLGAKDTPLEEWLRLSDIRNNLTVSIHRKEEELSRLTDSRRLDQPKRANYNY